MQEKYIHAIAGIHLFSSIKKEELRHIFSTSKYTAKEYEKGQMIHIQNEKCTSLDIILEGQVAINKIDENGNILTINVFSSRDMIGANLLFSRENNYPMTVISKTKAVLLHLNKEFILKLCQNNVDFMTNLLEAISDRTLILTDKINKISLRTIRQGIIEFLKYEHHIQKSPIITLNITKKELAERFGISRTSLSRELHKMRRDGLVEYDARTITIKDLDISEKY